MTHISNRGLLALTFFIVFAFVLGLRAHGQQPQKGQAAPQPTFRVQVEYVEVDAIARDKQGRFVADLQRDDFEVLEDGQRQQIAGMELVEVPVEPQPTPALLAGRRFEPDVVSNAQRPGRVYLIVLDDLHVLPARTAFAKKIAHDFIDRNFAPNDLAAVVTTGGRARSTQEFTSSRRLVLQAVDRLVGRKVISPGLAKAGGGLSLADAQLSDTMYAQERIFNARSSLETLAQLATFAGTIHNRRKAIILISEGSDYDLALQSFDAGENVNPGQVTSSLRSLRDELKLFVDAANRANVTLYALDPRVYTQGGDDLVEIAIPPTRLANDTSAEKTVFGPLVGNLKASQDNLRVMATETGGFAAVESLAAVGRAFDRIRDENSRYYILGYYPANARRDGKFRKIEVRVKRPGVEVVARKGYVAPKGDKPPAPAAADTKDTTSAPLREALGSAVPTPGLPISVTATPFRGAGGQASILVMLQTPPGAVKFVERNDRIEGNLEVSFIAMDEQGKTRGGEHLDLTMPLKRETAEMVQKTGLLVQSRVTLPPGRYVLRAGARDGTSQRVGSIHCDLEVPDYAQLPLSMSGLVISSAQTALANPRPDKNLTTMLPGSPVVVRDFRQDAEVGVLAEIYDAKASTPHDIDIVTTLVSEEGGVEVYRHDDRRSTGEVPGGTQGGFGYLLQVPLAGLAPGTYLLRVEARSRLDASNPVARETAIKVVAR